MNIRINKLELLNFKGIKNLAVSFNDITNISGDNGTGKSTIFDAFTWLLFGKDSHDVKDFNIKTLDKDGSAIPQIEHAVTGIITVDGAETTLKRVYVEKWIRRRGSEESELSGHETLFYWNGVPCQAGEYKAKVAELVDEGLFKLLTSSTAFNSMKWQDRRQVLIDIAGTISTDSVLSSMNNQQVSVVTGILNAGKDLAEFKKEISVKKKKLSDDLRLIPSRIDEVQRGLPPAEDFEKIRLSINEKNASIAEIEAAITNQVEAYKKQAEQQQAIQGDIYALRNKQKSIEYALQTEQQKLKNEYSLKVNDLRQRIDAATKLKSNNELRIQSLKNSLRDAEEGILKLRQQWETISKEQVRFDPNEFICPTCKRELDPIIIAERKDQMIESFSNDQSRRLSNIELDGKKMSVLAEQCREEIKLIESTNKDIDRELESLNTAQITEPQQGISATENPDYIEAGKQIEKLELQLLESPKLNIDGLKQQKATIQDEIYTMNVILGYEEIINRGKLRVEELMRDEKNIAQQISDFEKQEFAIESFTRTKMDKVEQAINNRFVLVKFKMFNTLLNGQVEECCETLVNGVPYSDVNSAGKIQAGIDIINTLSDHYGIYCPVWCDNRETVNNLPPIKSQLINLIVTKESLTIN